LTANPTIDTPFVRTRATWLLYALLAYFAYVQSLVSPAVNFLGAELDLSYTVRGLHVTLFAAGALVAGALGETAARRIGRTRLVWGGIAVMVIATVGLASAQSAVVSVGSTLIMGFAGTFSLIMIQSLLSDLHGSQRTRALTEANVLAVLLTTFAPFVVGAAENAGIEWRVVLLVSAACYTALWLAGRGITIDPMQKINSFAASVSHSKWLATREKVSLDTSELGLASRFERLAGEGDSHLSLPRVFWLYWLFVLFAVGIEWSLIFWSADFLERIVGFTKADATSAVTAFLGAMTIGRFVGSRLAANTDSLRLLIISVTLALFGFSIFWLAPIPSLNLVGLFLAGLGAANLYPLGLSIVTGLEPSLSDRASARIVLAASGAIFLAPQLLGSLADRVGIQSALGVTGLLAFSALAILLVAQFGFGEQRKEKRENF
jgi:MFS family permease